MRSQWLISPCLRSAEKGKKEMFLVVRVQYLTTLHINCAIRQVLVGDAVVATILPMLSYQNQCFSVYIQVTKSWVTSLTFIK